VGGFPNKASARAELNEILSRINRGEYVETKTITFSEFAENYISNRLSLRGSTVAAYASIIRKHLIPFFDKMKLQEIKLKQVQNFVNQLAEKVSAKTLRNCVTLLNVMLFSPKGSSALKEGYLRFNPVAGVELPSLDPKQVVPPTIEQVWRLIDIAAALKSIGYGIIYVDAFTGLRRGEILALRFDDIDWFQREVVINKSLAKHKAVDGMHQWV
jgi:integrase